MCLLEVSQVILHILIEISVFDICPLQPQTFANPEDLNLAQDAEVNFNEPQVQRVRRSC